MSHTNQESQEEEPLDRYYFDPKTEAYRRKCYGNRSGNTHKSNPPPQSTPST